MRPLPIVILVCFCTAAPAAETRSIKVSAMSEIKAAPDEVVLQLGVHTRDKQLLIAKHENDKIAAAVLDLVPAYGIPGKDVKVTDLDVQPDHGQYGHRQAAPIAYDFTRSIEVRLTDFEKIEPFLSDAFNAGLSQVSNLQFRVSNQRLQQFEARELAVTYAREKAKHLTELTGMKLGPPIHIEENVEHNWDAGGFGGFGGPSAAHEPNKNGDKIAATQSPFTLAAFQQAAGKKAKVPIAPGQVIITAEVTIEFEMSK